MARHHSHTPCRKTDRRRYKGGGRSRSVKKTTTVLKTPAKASKPEAKVRAPQVPVIYQFPEFHIPEMPTYELPEPPPPEPPATEYRDEVEEAGREERRKARRRRGMLASLFAGETGGYRASNQTGRTQVGTPSAAANRSTLGGN